MIKKFSNKLPTILQTDTQKEFFSATFDQLFSPAEVEQAQGFIGQRSSKVFRPREDNYLGEPTKLRAAYQLEPIAYAVNAALEDTNEMFYEDLLNYIEQKGGNIGNHDRLFADDFYSFAPPIDVDKYINYQNYLWLEDGGPTIYIQYQGGGGGADFDSIIENQIIGAVQFNTSENDDLRPRGLDLSSGMRIRFEGSASYDRPLWLEGVGREIRLVEELTTIQPGDTVVSIPWDNGIIAEGAAGTNYAITMDTGGASTLVDDGAGYTASDIVSVWSPGNAGVTTPATITINTVGGSGEITGYTLTSAGSYLFKPAEPIGVVGPTILAQDETNFDTLGTNGSFDGGTGHNDGDVITLSDGTQVTIPAGGQAAGVVTAFDITTISTGPKLKNATLTQTGTTGSGTGFSLTLGDANESGSGATFTLPIEGELVTVSGGTFTVAATLRPIEVTAGGAVVQAEIVNRGTYTVAPTAPAATTSAGAGTGLQVDFAALGNAGELWDSSYDEPGFDKSVTSTVTDADYLTIERGSCEGSVWSRTNRWFNVDIVTTAQTLGQIIDATIVQGGINYSVGDQLPVAGDGINGVVTVVSTDGAGSITGIRVSGRGQGYSFGGIDQTGAQGTTDTVLWDAEDSTPTPSGESWDTSFVWDEVITSGGGQDAIIAITLASAIDRSNKGERPILEFTRDLQLYDFGNHYVMEVDVVADNEIYADIEGQPAGTVVDGIPLADGMRMIFLDPSQIPNFFQWDETPGTANDEWDEVPWEAEGASGAVSRFIWEINIVAGVISLIKVDPITGVADSNAGPVAEGDVVIATLGNDYAGESFYQYRDPIDLDYTWRQCQTRTGVNTAPLFELYDYNGIQLADTILYPNSTFTGNELFSYRVLTAADVVDTGESLTNDAILGFPLTLTGLRQISDIVFENDVETNRVTYDDGEIPGYYFYKEWDAAPDCTIRTDAFGTQISEFKTNWRTSDEPERQRVIDRFLTESDTEDEFVLSAAPRVDNTIFDIRINEGRRLNSDEFAYVSSTGTIKIFEKPVDTGFAIADGTDSLYAFQGIVAPAEVIKDGIYQEAGLDYNVIESVQLDEIISVAFGGTGYTVNDILTVVGGTTEDNANLRVVSVDGITGAITGVFITNRGVYAEAPTSPFSVMGGTGAGAQFEGVFVDATGNSFTVQFIDSNGIPQVVPAGEFIEVREQGSGAPGEGVIVEVIYSTFDEVTDADRGFFEIPNGLENNPNNLEIEEASWSQFAPHMVSIIENQDLYYGTAFGGINNYRDSEKDAGEGEYILQSQSPLLKTMLAASSDSLDIVDAMRFSGKEYARYKNKFVKEAKKLIDQGFTPFNEGDSIPVDQWVDEIIRRIVRSKEYSTAFQDTYMLAYGTVYEEETYDFVSELTFGTTTRYFNTLVNYVDLADKRNTMYVYVNETIQRLDVDYIISNDNPIEIEWINVPTGTFTITVRMYENMAPAHIPATVQKLGLHQVSQPRTELDESYQTPLTVLVGHDGSRTPVYDDYRDDLLFEFETRIYNGILEQFRVDYQPPLEEDNYKPAKHRSTRWSKLEWDRLLRPSFFKWVASAKADYVTNEFYDPANPWTWNYSTVVNAEGDTLPGYWRGIFDWYYCTQTPQSTPWEMLGFHNEPSWWEAEYGAAPYLSTNPMWADIEAGLIRQGYRAGTDTRYAHAGLTANSLPVDSNGDLLATPLLCIANDGSLSAPNSSEAAKNWTYGDVAPVEYAWRAGEEYPFAVAEAMFLARPGEFGEKFWDPEHTFFVPARTSQIVSDDGGIYKRIGNSGQYVHGETVGGVAQVNTGWQVWVSSRLRALGKNLGNDFGQLVRTLDVKLGHKMASFTNKDTMSVTVEGISVSSQANNLLIPQENINVSLHTGTPVREYVYGGVLIRAQADGSFQLFGYDILGGEFNYIPRRDAHPRNTNVNVGGQPEEFTTWKSGNTYAVSNIVRFNSLFYRCNTANSDTTFDPAKWSKLSKLPTVGGINVTYKPVGTGEVAQFQYGSELATAQEVYDLIIGYGDWLESEGWVFENRNPEVGDVETWRKAADQFLLWTQTNWQAGSIVMISPAATGAKLEAQEGYPAEVERIINGVYAILDKNGVVIDPRNTIVKRDGRSIEIIPAIEQVGVYGARILTTETESIVTFDNVTDFNDTIYDPLLGSRLARLYLNVRRTTDWTGKLEAGGYIITEDGLIPNFENMVDSIRFYHDTETILDNPDIENAARHLIGFSVRDYYEDLQIENDSMFQFYQGAIRHKGTVQSIRRLERSTKVGDATDDTEVFEEWALKRGEFGNICGNQMTEFLIAANEVKVDPQLVQLEYPRSNIAGDCNWFQAADITGNNITITAHGFSTGDLVVYTEALGDIPELTSGSIYSVIVVDANTISLANVATPTVALSLTAPAGGLVGGTVRALASFVSEGDALGVQVSSDGDISTWTQINTPDGGISFPNVGGISWSTAQNIWVAVMQRGSGAATNVQFSTNDGTSWSSVTRPAFTPATGGRNRLVDNNGSLFVIGGNSGTAIVSSDGQTFVASSPGPNPVVGTDQVISVHWSEDNSLWFIGTNNGKVATSPDGHTWTLRTNPSTTNDVRGIDSVGTRVFVGTDAGDIKYSDDQGDTWTAAVISGTAIGAADLSRIVTDGAGTIVAGAGSLNNGEYVWRSTDNGVNFSSVDVATQLSIADIYQEDLIYDPTYGFIIGGENNTDGNTLIATSPDGLTWTTRFNQPSVHFNSGNNPVTSITRAGTTATVTTSGSHFLTNGTSVTISGANEADYNITATIFNAGGTTFDYTVAGSPTSPATGTIEYRYNLDNRITAMDTRTTVSAPVGTFCLKTPINGVVSSIDIVSQSNTYTSVPTVTLVNHPEDPQGTGATAQAVLDSDGTLLRIDVLNPGYGYILPPTVYIGDLVIDASDDRAVARIQYTITEDATNDDVIVIDIDDNVRWPTKPTDIACATDEPLWPTEAPIANQFIETVVLNAAGTGYAVNDVLIVEGGVPSTQATITVSSISGGGPTGPITGFSFTPGRYVTAPTGTVTTESSIGTGATFDITVGTFEKTDYNARKLPNAGNVSILDTNFSYVSTAGLDAFSTLASPPSKKGETINVAYDERDAWAVYILNNLRLTSENLLIESQLTDEDPVYSQGRVILGTNLSGIAEDLALRDATLTFTQAAGSVTNVTVTDSGYGYWDEDSITISTASDSGFAGLDPAIIPISNVDGALVLNTPQTTVLSQNNDNFRGIGEEGTFDGGTGYYTDNEITLTDGTIIQVNTLVGGGGGPAAVETFTITTKSTTPFNRIGTLEQDSVTAGAITTGTGFTLTLGGANAELDQPLGSGYTSGGSINAADIPGAKNSRRYIGNVAAAGQGKIYANNILYDYTYSGAQTATAVAFATRGTGYTVGDELSVNGGFSNTSPALINVDSIRTIATQTQADFDGVSPNGSFVQGSGYSASRNTFDSATDVDTGNDEITITAHGYTTGDSVVLREGTTVPTGLADNTVYYIIAIDANTVQFASSAANALSGVGIDITAAGTGVHTLSDTIVLDDTTLITVDTIGISTIQGQTHANFDNSPATEGTFTTGQNYAVNDTITLTDGTLVTVNALDATSAVQLIVGQNHNNFDAAGSNGTFVGGDGIGGTAYEAGDTITLSDGAVVEVLAVDANGDVTEFEIIGASTSSSASLAVRTQSNTSSTGTNFTLTPGTNNEIPFGAVSQFTITTAGNPTNAVGATIAQDTTTGNGTGFSLILDTDNEDASLGAVNTFTVYSSGTALPSSGSTQRQAQTTETGVGFELTLDSNNEEILAVTLTTGGDYSVIPTGTVTVNGGTGDGATFTLSNFLPLYDISKDGAAIEDGTFANDTEFFVLTNIRYRNTTNRDNFAQEDIAAGMRTVWIDNNGTGSWEVQNVFAPLIAAQDETAYNGGWTVSSGDHGTFDGGDGHAAADVITLSNGATITVDAVSTDGVVTEFTVTTIGSAVQVGDTLLQTSTTGGGIAFSITVDSHNLDTSSVTYTQRAVQEVLIDTTKFKQAYVYDADTGDTVSQLPVYDPFKGIIPGTAELNIKWMTRHDPARYNNSNDARLLSDTRLFGSDQVGLLWWDLSTCAYLYYEQGSNTYRRDHWGKFIDGSSVDIYEWTRSSVAPANYEGDGTVRSTTDYVQLREWDPILEEVRTYYYFWVKDRTIVPDGVERTAAAFEVSRILANPASQLVDWFSPVSSNAFVFAGIEGAFTDSDNIIQINYQEGTDEKPEHVEWQLAREGDPDYTIRPYHWDKMVDSLCGYTDLVPVGSADLVDTIATFGTTAGVDGGTEVITTDAAHGFTSGDGVYYSTQAGSVSVGLTNGTMYWVNVITTTTLSLHATRTDALGDANRIDLTATGAETHSLTSKSTALYNFDDAIVSAGDATQGYLIVPDPTLSTTQRLGIRRRPLQSMFDDMFGARRVFVDKVNELMQYVNLRDELPTWADSMTTTNLWDWVDWYEVGYDATNTIPTFQVSAISAMDNIAQKIDGDIIRVTGTRWRLYEYDEDADTFTLVGREGSRLQLSSDIYTKDKNLADAIELRELITALKDNVFTVDRVVYSNLLFFALLNYVFSEQEDLDWAFKTTYIFLKQQGRTLQQDRVYQNDPFDSALDFINEVKPYQTKIRDFRTERSAEIDLVPGTADELVRNFNIDMIYDRFRGGDLSVQEMRIAKNEIAQSNRWDGYTTKDGGGTLYRLGAAGRYLASQDLSDIADIDSDVSDAYLTNPVTASLTITTNALGQVISAAVVSGGQGYYENVTFTITDATLAGNGNAQIVINVDTANKGTILTASPSVQGTGYTPNQVGIAVAAVDMPAQTSIAVTDAELAAVAAINANITDEFAWDFEGLFLQNTAFTGNPTLISAEIDPLNDGSGYALDDILTMDAGSGVPISNASFKVTGIDGGGAITELLLINGGSYQQTPTVDPVDLLGGSGDGLAKVTNLIFETGATVPFDTTPHDAIGWDSSTFDPSIDSLEGTPLDLYRTIPGQTQADFDGVAPNGSFTTSAGHAASDVITLNDDTEILVDAVDGGGSVTQFTIQGGSTSPNTSEATLTFVSSTGSGTDFTLTLGTDNQSAANFFTVPPEETFTADGSQREFTLTTSVITPFLFVVVDGVEQVLNVDYFFILDKLVFVSYLDANGNRTAGAPPATATNNIQVYTYIEAGDLINPQVSAGITEELVPLDPRENLVIRADTWPIVINATGTGYSIADVLTVVGGTGTATEITVLSVDGGGAITSYEITNTGTYTVYPGVGATTTVAPAGGSGATFDVEGPAVSFTIHEDTQQGIAYYRNSDAASTTTASNVNPADTAIAIVDGVPLDPQPDWDNPNLVWIGTELVSYHGVDSVYTVTAEAVNRAGTGYTVGDVLTVDGNTISGTSNALITVDTIADVVSDAATIDFTTNTITRTGGTAFDTLGFQIGMVITVSAATNGANNVSATIAGVSATVITVDGAPFTADTGDATAVVTAADTITAATLTVQGTYKESPGTTNVAVTGGTIAAQDETNFDNTGFNGTWVPGSGYAALDTITMDDGSVITVDAVDQEASITFDTNGSGVVTGVTLVSGGSGYQTNGSFNITVASDGGFVAGTEATVSYTVSGGAINTVNLDNPGTNSGYSINLVAQAVNTADVPNPTAGGVQQFTITSKTTSASELDAGSTLITLNQSSTSGSGGGFVLKLDTANQSGDENATFDLTLSTTTSALIGCRRGYRGTHPQAHTSGVKVFRAEDDQIIPSPETFWTDSSTLASDTGVAGEWRYVGVTANGLSSIHFYDSTGITATVGETLVVTDADVGYKYLITDTIAVGELSIVDITAPGTGYAVGDVIDIDTPATGGTGVTAEVGAVNATGGIVYVRITARGSAYTDVGALGITDANITSTNGAGATLNVYFDRAGLECALPAPILDVNGIIASKSSLTWQIDSITYGLADPNVANTNVVSVFLRNGPGNAL